MPGTPAFVSVGKKIRNIDVRLSYEIVRLLSEGLYASPNKAVEELVANSFDAGATTVIVLHSPNLHSADANLVVVDDGVGMNVADLATHWLIGLSKKRELKRHPLGRAQIGKFGIGKLATYVLARRFTHITKKDGEYFSTSMDYAALDDARGKQAVAKTPIKLGVRKLTEAEAKEITIAWTGDKRFLASGLSLFGKSAPSSWTFAILSDLKDKVHHVSLPFLKWVLSTALPLRDDFSVWFDGDKLTSSKAGRGLLEKWTLGRELTELAKPAPKDISVSIDKHAGKDDPKRFGLYLPLLGRITGYVEAYKELITGKSDAIGRSYGFFVYVRERLINVVDGHFGIDPNELRHGTFGRLRIVVHIDGLDSQLNSDRESLQDGPVKEAAQDVLRGIFNSVRRAVADYEEAQLPGAALAAKLAATPASVSRRPLVDLARAVYAGTATSSYLRLPTLVTRQSQDDFLAAFAQRAREAAESFVRDRVLDLNGNPEGVLAVYDADTSRLIINALHPFVATFYEMFEKKATSLPLELMAMAEILYEAQLFDAGLTQDKIDEVLASRDRLLRILADSSGHQGAHAIAKSLLASRNSPDELEQRMCDACRSLGFQVSRIGKKGEPDGLATAVLSADEANRPRRYKLCLEAKSKEADGKRVSARTIAVSALQRHREKYDCDHTLVVAPAFSTELGADSATAQEIAADHRDTKRLGRARTITLITIDDLARLVRLRPKKNLSLITLRDMFVTCGLPEETRAWIDQIEKMKVVKPPYAKIIHAIYDLAEEFQREAVDYGALRTALSRLHPPVKYETNEDLITLCTGMAQMAPGAISASRKSVELVQSAENVIKAIDDAVQEDD